MLGEDQFLRTMKMYLALPVYQGLLPENMIGRSQCPAHFRNGLRCDGILDNRHIIALCTKYHWARHENLLNAVCHVSRLASLSSAKNVDVLLEGRSRPADALISGCLDGREVVIDTSIATVFKSGEVGMRQVITSSRKILPKAVINREKEKNRKYKRTVEALGYRFVPFVLSTVGITGPQAKSYLEGNIIPAIAKQMCARTHAARTFVYSYMWAKHYEFLSRLITTSARALRDL